MFYSFHTLTVPHLSTVLHTQSNEVLTIGSAGVQGLRGSMEDSHSILLQPNGAFVGVFDGHAGAECSYDVSQYFTNHLTKVLPPYSDDQINNFCQEADNEVLKKDYVAGSTGTCVVAELVPGGGEYDLTVWNVGDSRINVYHRESGECLPLTVDHKPTLECEQERIEASGHTVECGRIDGTLGVSRAFGDAPFKFGTGPLAPVVSTPEIRRTRITGSDFVVVAACDGLFENDISNESIGEVIARAPRDVDAAGLAFHLCRHAIRCGSCDNVTVVVMFLSPPPANHVSYVERLPGPFTPTKDENFVKSYVAWTKSNGFEFLQDALDHRRKVLQQNDGLRRTCYIADDDDALFSCTDLEQYAGVLMAPIQALTFVCTRCGQATKKLCSIRDQVESTCPLCEDDTLFKSIGTDQLGLSDPRWLRIKPSLTGHSPSKSDGGLLDGDDDDIPLEETPRACQSSGIDCTHDASDMSPMACNTYVPWEYNERVCAVCFVPEFQHP
eukprot:PhF_6_TR26435/c3_g1_i1/m.38268/K14803/PTC2_3; protein phosphatase PTC2/3